MKADIGRLGLTEKQQKAKRASLRKKYDISLEEFALILERQGWECPVCKTPYSPIRLWAVDHEHRTGLEGPVRGICCFRCNRYKIGRLTKAEAFAISEYLINPPAYDILGGERIAQGQPKRKKRRRKSAGTRGDSRSDTNSPRGVRGRRRKSE